MENVLSIIIVGVAMCLAQSLDILAMMARAGGDERSAAEHIALSGWIFYISRIVIMLVVLGLSIRLESGPRAIPAPELLAISLGLSIFFSILTIRSSSLAERIYTILSPIIRPSFPTYKSSGYWVTIDFSARNRLSIMSAISTFVLLLGATTPFIISDLYPHFRMTSVYIGQLANFGATIIVLSYQDPVFNRRIDSGNKLSALSSVITGKILGLIAFTIVLTVFILLRRSVNA